MSRSRRKTPIMGVTTCKSEKQDKRINNRKLRKATKTKLKNEEEVLSVMREISDVWSMGKDGRQRIPDPETSRYMRK